LFYPCLIFSSLSHLKVLFNINIILLFVIYIVHLLVVRPRSCRVIYYFDNPTLKRRYQSFDRVIGIKENAKFQKKDDPAAAIKSIVNISKEKHELKYMYVWHAITGLLGWGPYRSQGDGGIWVNDEVSNGVKGGGG
jgi:hypothetical protein